MSKKLIEEFSQDDFMILTLILFKSITTYLDFSAHLVNHLVQHLHVTALNKNVALLYATS